MVEKGSDHSSDKSPSTPEQGVQRSCSSQSGRSGGKNSKVSCTSMHGTLDGGTWGASLGGGHIHSKSQKSPLSMARACRLFSRDGEGRDPHRAKGEIGLEAMALAVCQVPWGAGCHLLYLGINPMVPN